MNAEVRKLTQVEAEQYIRQLVRRGTAKSLPAEQIEHHRKAYDTLTAYLKLNYKAYILYCLMDNKCPSKKALIKTIDRSKTSGLLYKLNEALDYGDAEEFQWYCWLLKLVYCVFRQEEQVLLKQKETIDL